MRWSKDDWLADLLGKSCFNLVADHSPDIRIPPIKLDAPAFLSAKVDVTKPGLISMLEKDGFSLSATALTLTADNYLPEATKARLARPDDEPAVRNIAATAFSETRFHCDPCIPVQTADRIKEEWAANYFSGNRGDSMIVVEDEGSVAGFLLAIKQPDNFVIDLIAVGTSARNKGYGKAMIDRLGEHYGSPGLSIRVGTQLSNTRSLEFYQKLGFRLTSAHYMFHKHI